MHRQSSNPVQVSKTSHPERVRRKPNEAKDLCICSGPAIDGAPDYNNSHPERSEARVPHPKVASFAT
jgi:hypothetical protein